MQKPWQFAGAFACSAVDGAANELKSPFWWNVQRGEYYSGSWSTEYGGLPVSGAFGRRVRLCFAFYKIPIKHKH